jgi:NADH:quinone reductase (non-electrogenic)
VAAHRVVVVGGGFGGLQAVDRLGREKDVEVTLVDRRNFHLFQPLTYQVATGALSPGEIAYPLRALFSHRPNVRVLLGEVTGFDLERREVVVAPVSEVPAPPPLAYDSLIVAGGSQYAYFGHDEWSDVAREVKSLESALAVRARILTAFEAAENEPDPQVRDAELTFVVVGAGPTGVEMAGQIGEMAHDTLPGDFRAIDSREARILLIEVVDRVLPTFPPKLSAKARRSLEKLGVTPMLDRTVVGIDHEGVDVKLPDGSVQRVPSRTVIWAAGVQASKLGAMLGDLTGAEVDRAGRVTVERDLSLPGRPEVMAIGDMARVRDASGRSMALPGVAQVAIQQGRYCARRIADRVAGRETEPFHYHDKGNLATIGRGRAVADLPHVRLSGLPAWGIWLVVHLWSLIGFQNRLLVLIRWLFSFATHGRGARLITREPDEAMAED